MKSTVEKGAGSSINWIRWAVKAVKGGKNGERTQIFFSIILGLLNK